MNDRLSTNLGKFRRVNYWLCFIDNDEVLSFFDCSSKLLATPFVDLFCSIISSILFEYFIPLFFSRFGFEVGGNVFYFVFISHIDEELGSVPAVSFIHAFD